MTEALRLREQTLVTFVATSDPDRAMKFYRDVLNLRFVADESPFALVFDAHGIPLRVTMVKEVHPAGYTVLGWQVPSIAAAAQALADAGVRFERFAGLQQDERGVWSAPGGTKVAWFQDPDGNVLSISEFAR